METHGATAGWSGLWSANLRHQLERALPAFLLRQRWFGGKARAIAHIRIRDVTVLSAPPAVLLLADVKYFDGEDDCYFVPLVPAAPESAPRRSPETSPDLLTGGEDQNLDFRDGTTDPEFCQWLLRVSSAELRIPWGAGTLVGRAGRALAGPRGDEAASLPVHRNLAEQSNTSVRFGDQYIMKLFRRLWPGANPDCEITRYLSEDRRNAHVPAFAGSLHYLPEVGEELTLGLVQELVANQGDGWTWTLGALDRYFEACNDQTFPAAWQGLWDTPLLSLRREDLPVEARAAIAPYLAATEILARRTAEMHLDLATPTSDPSFRTRPMHGAELAAYAQHLCDRALAVLDDLADRVAALPRELHPVATTVLAGREAIVLRFQALEEVRGSVRLARIHGDYHLGQVLRTGADFVVLDFEGEPTRPLSERRSLQSPLKDVAGMLRSFSYAARVAHGNFVAAVTPKAGPAEAWAALWEVCVSTVFLATYRAAVAGTGLLPGQESDVGRLLEAFLLDKAFYELDYELNHRPDWARVPLLAIAGLGRLASAQAQRRPPDQSEVNAARRQ
jgi:maltose alpha-D-glucosyltransferase/alpha-amylase